MNTTTTSTETNWMPTRKWMARTIVALGGLAIMYFTTGSWDVEESVGAITLIVGALTSYLIPNEEPETVTTVRTPLQ